MNARGCQILKATIHQAKAGVELNYSTQCLHRSGSTLMIPKLNVGNVISPTRDSIVSDDGG